jgi:hypothetical protein
MKLGFRRETIRGTLPPYTPDAGVGSVRLSWRRTQRSPRRLVRDFVQQFAAENSFRQNNRGDARMAVMCVTQQVIPKVCPSWRVAPVLQLHTSARVR